MDLIQLILQNGGQEVISQVARRTGLPEDQAANLLGQVMPALGQGIKRKLSDPDQMQEIVGELSQGRLQQAFDNPEVIGKDEMVQDGNAILGKVFGSKDVSRNVANRVAEQSGTSPDIVKQLLPVAATLIMGALGKETQKRDALGGTLSQANVDTTTISSTLMEFLDMDNDGDVMDDVLNLAQKFFK